MTEQSGAAMGGGRPVERPAPIDLNAGVLAPVADEVTLTGPTDLVVSGSLPPGLDGLLVRNGPNPLDGRFAGTGVLDWWPEAAMWHGIRLRDGRAVEYRNRWARTRRWAETHRGAGAEAGAGAGAGAGAPQHLDELVDTNPNVSFVDHGGELLALAEGGPPLVVGPGLETLGPTGRHPALAAGANAHPRIDPETGELISFASGWMPPYLRSTVSAADGTTVVDTTVDLPEPVMIHDLAITADHSIILDLNVGLDLSMLEAGHRIPIRWKPDKAARIGLLARSGGEPIWFEVEPCFVQHVVNAHEVPGGPGGRGPQVVLDAIRYPWYFRLDGHGPDAAFAPDPLGILWRWTLDLTTGTVTEEALDHHTYLELPRIDESRTGRSYRYCFAVEQPTDTEMRGVRRHDVTTGAVDRWAPPPGDQNSEAVFVPRPGRPDGPDAEGDGWLLVCVYRAATDTTDLVVLDAMDLARGPLGSVHLPRRIPAGFHGLWRPEPGPLASP